MFKMLKLIGLTTSEESIARFLLNDFKTLMNKDFDDIVLKIENIPSRAFPMTCPKRLNAGQREDFIIFLCYKPNYWCQMIYQLSHELGHFFMNCYPERKYLKWISECLCELFSVVFLNRSISFFKSFSPYYVESVESYINDYLEIVKRHSTLTCKDLISKIKVDLENNPIEDGVNGRPRNSYISAKLYEKVGHNGNGISAVCLFDKLDESKTSNEFFELWIQKCRSADEIKFVSTIKQVLGL